MKIITTVTAVSAIVLSQNALSQSSLPDALHCPGMENDIARLECYDSSYADFRAAEMAPGNWQVIAKTSPIDDTVTTALVVDSSGGTSPMFGEHRLIIRCQGKELNVWVNWNEFLSSESASDITWRVGQQKPQTDKWPHGSNSSSLTFYPRDEQTLVTQLMGSNQFVAQTKTAVGETLTAIFNTKGLEQAATPIKSDCLAGNSEPYPDYMNKELFDAMKSIEQRDEYRAR